MSGVITFSNEELWFVSGRVWALLMERATEDAEDEDERDNFSEALYSNGLSFRRLDTQRRKSVASVLLRSTTGLISEFSNGDGRREAFTERLRELVPLLEQELADP